MLGSVRDYYLLELFTKEIGLQACHENFKDGRSLPVLYISLAPEFLPVPLRVLDLHFECTAMTVEFTSRFDLRKRGLLQ